MEVRYTVVWAALHLVILLALSQSIAPQLSSATHKKSYKNPVIPDGREADVAVFVDHKAHRYVATSTGGGKNKFRILTSPDLVNWTHVGYIFPQGSRGAPKWATPNSDTVPGGGVSWWAPEITYARGKYIALFAASCGKGYPMCIGLATAKSATGPWRDSGRPLVRRASVMNLDPTLSYDVAKREYVVIWKRYDAYAYMSGAGVNVQSLSKNLLTLKPGSSPSQIIPINLKWEADVIEGPSVYRRNGYYYIFYSANHFASKTCDYAIGVARSRNIRGPYTKQLTPMVHKSRNFCNTGSPNVVPLLKNSKSTYLIYHGSIVGHNLMERSMLMDKLLWSKRGWPYIKGNVPSHTPQPVPH